MYHGSPRLDLWLKYAAITWWAGLSMWAVGILLYVVLINIILPNWLIISLGVYLLIGVVIFGVGSLYGFLTERKRNGLS